MRRDRRDATPSAIDYLHAGARVRPDLAAAAAEIERRRELPEPIVAALAERGFFRLLLPRSLGGAELLPAPYVPVIEEIAKADASTAWCLNQGAGCSMTAAYLDRDAAREIFGRPRGILAWGPGPGKATNRPRRLPRHRDLELCQRQPQRDLARRAMCRSTTSDGTPLLHPDGSPVIRTVLFPKSQTEMTDIWHVIGLRGTGSDKYSVTDLFVPRGMSRRATTTAPAARRGCSTASAACSSMPRALPGWRWGSPAAPSTPLSSWRATRCRSAATHPARQQCRPVAGGAGRGAAARGARLSLSAARGDHRRGRASAAI